MYNVNIKKNFLLLPFVMNFDKTLSPKDMQAQGFIQDIGYDVNKFWQEQML